MDCEIAILKTLTYSDLFDYPITLNQLYTFLITKNSYTKEAIIKTAKGIKKVLYKNGFYVFKNRAYLIEDRIKKEEDNKEKLIKAGRISHILSVIPTIYFIGISGSVAMQNANKHDDIDLFVITKKNTLWISRLLLLIFLQMLQVRRTYKDRDVKEKICLNMLLDEDMMGFSKNRQDIYTAHEIAQVIPLFSRRNTYEIFLRKNDWVRQYMRNAFVFKKKYKQMKIHSLFEYLISLPFIEYSAKLVQNVIIQKHRTSETVTKKFLAFHPFDYRKRTIDVYNKRIKQYV